MSYRDFMVKATDGSVGDIEVTLYDNDELHLEDQDDSENIVLTPEMWAEITRRITVKQNVTTFEMSD